MSPCVSAPLAGALIYISSTGDAVLGGTALLTLGLGMGVPLIIIGASGGHLLPILVLAHGFWATHRILASVLIALGRVRTIAWITAAWLVPSPPAPAPPACAEWLHTIPHCSFRSSSIKLGGRKEQRPKHLG